MYRRTFLLLFILLFSLVSSNAQDNLSELVVGKWTKSFNDRSVTLVLTSEKKYEVEFAGDSGIDVWGSFAISENQITFSDEGGEYGSDESGVYEVKLNDTSITFTEVDDPVYGRRLLVEGEWTKAESP